MAANNNLHPHLLVRKLDSIGSLTQDEREALVSLPLQIQDIRADQDIVREGDRPSRSFLLMEGFACSFKFTGEGKRQITAFHMPGDIPDLQSLYLKRLSASVGTIRDCKVGFIQHDNLRELCARFPGITIAFWRQTLIDGAAFREWTVNIGQRQAYNRVAHVLCEIVMRMRAAGLVQDHMCEFPMTQTELADAVGMSTVHVNRTLQQLRGAGLIALKEGILRVLDWDRLQDAGDFDPSYLHLDHPQAA